MNQQTITKLRRLRAYLMASTEFVIDTKSDPAINEEEYLSLMQLLSKSTLTVANILRTNDPDYKENLK